MSNIFKFYVLVLLLVLLSSCEYAKLIVTNGSGSGNYASNATVKIKSNLPQPGYEFNRWTGDVGTIQDEFSKETIIKIPEFDEKEEIVLRIQATYEVDPSAKEYELVIENGEGSGHFLTYSIVTIKAHEPEEGFEFSQWSGDTKYLNNVNQKEQKIVIGKEDVHLVATYKKIPIPTPEPTPTHIPTPVPTSPPPISGTIKLMPIGDSITHGSARFGDIRCKLWSKLKSAGLSFDFVGGMRNKLDNTFNPSCDENHQAQSGARADYILGIIGGSAATFKPDMATIFLGINDLRAKQSISSTVNEISQIIDQLRFYSPHIVIFVAGINPDFSSPTSEYNAALFQMVKNKTTLASPLLFVDQHTGFGPADQMDGLHPNDAGAEKIASRWAEAIINYLE